MKTEEELKILKWLKDTYFNDETGLWKGYTIFQAMQEYAEEFYKSKLAEITDEDIEKWVDDEIKKEPMLGYSRAMMIYSAKAMRNGEIKHT